MSHPHQNCSCHGKSAMSPQRYSPQRFVMAAPQQMRYSPQRFAVAGPTQLRCSPQRFAVVAPQPMRYSPQRFAASPKMHCSPQRYAHAAPEMTKKDMAHFLLNSGAKVFFADWCGYCKRMIAEIEDALEGDADAIKKLRAHVLVPGEGATTSDGKPVRAFPTIERADGELLEGFSGLANLCDWLKKGSGHKGSAGLKALQADDLDAQKIEEMVKDGVKAYTKEWCGYCKKLKALHKDMAKLCVEAEDGAKGSDGNPIQGFPTIDFGDGEVVAGYMALDDLYNKFKAIRSKKNGAVRSCQKNPNK